MITLGRIDTRIGVPCALHGPLPPRLPQGASLAVVTTRLVEADPTGHAKLQSTPETLSQILCTLHPSPFICNARVALRRDCIYRAVGTGKFE